MDSQNPKRMMVLQVGAIIVLVWLYPVISDIFFLPMLFAILVGIAVGASIRTSELLGRPWGKTAVLLLVGIATLAAIGAAHLLPYLYLQSGRGETLLSLGSFLSWTDTIVMEIADIDGDSTWVIRGFVALLGGIFYEWLIGFIAALCTVDPWGVLRSTAQNRSETEPNKHKSL